MDAIGIDFAALLPAFMRAQEDDTAMAASLSPILRARALQLASLGIADFLCDADAPLTDAQASTLLDSLAGFLGLEWWRADWDITKKREMMGKAEQLRQLSESKWALETILRVYFGDPALTVEEWWEYGGAPYCFRVLTANAEAQAALRFKNVVELIKRQSQQWEGLWAGFSCRGVIYRGALGTDDTRLTGEAVLYRYLPTGTTVDGADGLAALSAILTAANPGQDVTDVLDDCFDYSAYEVTADLPLTFFEAGLPDWQAIPATRAAGARLDAAMSAHWSDVGADVDAPSLAYQWPPSGGGGSSLLEGLVAFFPLDGDGTDACGGSPLTWTSTSVSFDTGKVGQAIGADSGSESSTGGAYVVASADLASFTLAYWMRFSSTGWEIGKPLKTVGGSGQPGLGGTLDNYSWGAGHAYYRNTQTNPRVEGLIASSVGTAWHHYAETFDADTGLFCVYVDGTLAKSATVAIDANARVLTGISVHSSTNMPEPYGWGGKGWTDEAGVWSRALSADEVAALYQAGVDGVSYPFSGY